MILAIVQILLACMLWGAIFAVPLFLEDFCCTDIVLGRFFVFGILSLAAILFFILVRKQSHFMKFWKEAAISALIMNMIHFGALTLGIRLTTASLITLIMGTSPITIIVFSAWMKKETHLLSIFIWPSIAIFIGLGVMNIESMQSETGDISLWGYVQGIFFGIIALVTWTWYVVYNSQFMQTHPSVNTYQWTALVGVMTLIYTLVVIVGRYLVLGTEHFYQFHWEHESGRLFIGSVMLLGIFCSWVAFALWNAASFNIPPGLAGQLSILETIFGLCFVYTIEQTLPTALELLGITLILAGISAALYYFMQFDKPPTLPNKE